MSLEKRVDKTVEYVWEITGPEHWTVVDIAYSEGSVRFHVNNHRDDIAMHVDNIDDLIMGLQQLKVIVRKEKAPWPSA